MHKHYGLFYTNVRLFCINCARKLYRGKQPHKRETTVPNSLYKDDKTPHTTTIRGHSKHVNQSKKSNMVKLKNATYFYLYKNIDFIEYWDYFQNFIA